MALDTIGREFGEQGRVPDLVKSTGYVQGYGSDFLSGIEDLQPGQEEGMKELHFGPHGGCDRRGSL